MEDVTNNLDSEQINVNKKVAHTIKDLVQTNVYCEEFFNIKKNTTFTQKKRLPLDRFIEKNHADNYDIL